MKNRGTGGDSGSSSTMGKEGEHARKALNAKKCSVNQALDQWRHSSYIASSVTCKYKSGSRYLLWEAESTYRKKALQLKQQMAP